MRRDAGATPMRPSLPTRRVEEDPVWADARPCEDLPPPPHSAICAWDGDTTSDAELWEESLDTATPEAVTPERGVPPSGSPRSLVPESLAPPDSLEHESLEPDVVDLSSDDLEDVTELPPGARRTARELEREVGLEGDQARRVKILVQIAELHEREFLRPATAVEKLEEALSIDPTSVPALDALARCYRALRSWDRLVDVLERRASRERNPRRGAELWAHVAEVHATQRSDAEAATRAYLAALRHRPKSRRIVWALARLSERRGDYGAAAAYHGQLASLTEDKGRRAQIYCAIGELLAEDGRDPAGARANFERAVAIDPTRERAWEALQAYAMDEGDDERAASCLERRAAHTKTPRVKSALYVDLGNLRAHGLADAEGAFAAFDAAFIADPTNEAAAAATLDRYVANGSYEKARAACELLLEAARRDGDRSALQELLVVASRVAQASGDEGRALFGLVASFELAPMAEGVSDSLIESAHALRDQPHLLASARCALEAMALEAKTLSADLVFKLGDLFGVMGERDRATHLLEIALAKAPHHVPAIDRLIELAKSEEDHLTVARGLRRKAQVTRDVATQVRLLLDAGDVMSKKLGHLPAAAEDYEAARALAPRDHKILHTLLGVYTELGQFHEVARTLRSIVEAEPDSEKRAKVLFTLAQVAEQRLGDPEWAAEVFGEVLDLDGGRLDAFEQIARIHTEQHAWDALADAYVAMVKRLRASGDVALKHALCHQLGLIYRDRLGDAELALASFQTALALRPDDAEDQRILTELLVVLKDVPSAIELTRRSLARAPLADAPLRELYALFLRQRSFDLAWCAADLLALRGPLSKEQSSFLERFPPTPLHHVQGSLTAPAWDSHLLHPELDGTLTDLLRAVTPALLRARKLARIERGDAKVTPMTRVPEHVQMIFAHAAEILGVRAPRLRPRQRLDQPFVVADDAEDTVLVSVELASTLDDEVLAFLAGKCIALGRPELLARALCPATSELSSLVRAAVRVGAAVDTGAVTTGRFDAALLSHMKEDEVQALRAVVVEVLRSQPVLDVKRWAECAALSAARAGLLLAGTAGAAKRAEGHERRAPTDVPPAALFAHLTLFATSDAYGELRSALGFGVRA